MPARLLDPRLEYEATDGEAESIAAQAWFAATFGPWVRVEWVDRDGRSHAEILRRVEAELRLQDLAASGVCQKARLIN